MLQITPQALIDAYYADEESESQSRLKRLLKGIDEYNKKEDSTKEWFLIGSAVDCILTAEEGEFEKQYYILQSDKKPSESVLTVVTSVFESLERDYIEYLNIFDMEVKGAESWGSDTSIEIPAFPLTFKEFAREFKDHEVLILDACQAIDYYPKYGPEAKLKNMVGPGSAYFEGLSEAYGKKILSLSQYNTVNNIVNSLRNHPRTGYLFNREAMENETSIDVYYQLPVYFMYRGVKCKALLDIVAVHKNPDGTIKSVSPIDLKTMYGNTFDFHDSLIKRRYDIQASWYSLALCYHFGVEEGQVLPFKFVVESSSKQGKPLLFKVVPSLAHIGRYGRRAITLVDTNLFTEDDATEVISPAVLGFEQLLDMVIYHRRNGWHEERQVQELNHINNTLQLDWNGIVAWNSVDNL